MSNILANIPTAGIQSKPVDVSKPINRDGLKDLTILITGGASGFGAAFARHWSTHGANVIIGDVNHALGQSLIAELRTSTANENHHFLFLDVTSWTSQLDFFEQAVKLSPHGGIDCVVANAGLSNPDECFAFEKPVDYHQLARGGNAEISQPPELRVLDVNLTGVLYTAHLAASYLPLNPAGSKYSLESPEGVGAEKKRDRHLLLIGSLAGLSPLPTQSLYSVSKHAVVGLFRNLRITSPIMQGIRINMLCPYFTQTPILGALGQILMTGGGMADIDTVVEAATRLVADKRIIGRGLAVGPEVARADAESAGWVFGSETGATVNGVGTKEQGTPESPGGGNGVWEIYAHDFEQSDVFSRRVLGTTNLVAGRKGVLGLLKDLGWTIFGGVLARVWVSKPST